MVVVAGSQMVPAMHFVGTLNLAHWFSVVKVELLHSFVNSSDIS